MGSMFSESGPVVVPAPYSSDPLNSALADLCFLAMKGDGRDPSKLILTFRQLHPEIRWVEGEKK